MATGVAIFLFQRFVAQSFRPIDLTVGDLLNFIEDVPTSAAQLQKAYDWNISQWSTLGNALLICHIGVHFHVRRRAIQRVVQKARPVRRHARRSLNIHRFVCKVSA